jgi:peptidoglycan hydrolase-like protein with peptidoglycan-binding domain
MTKIAQTTVSKVLVAFVAAAMLFTMFATPAKAATTVEDLQKMISDLMAQIAALQGTTGTTTGGNCAAIPAPLTIGAQNANVTALQNYLIAAGQSIPAGATGYFGTQTQSALAAWQAANGVAPAVGYYGPITAAAMAAKCVTPGPTPTPTPDLKGGEGDLKVEVNLDGGIEIDLGKADTVLEFTVEAQDSDIAINRVDFEFSVRPWLYFQEVNLLVDGKEVASMSRSSDYSDIGSGNYRARFAGLNLVIREDDQVDVALEVVVLSSMAGNRVNDTATTTMRKDGIRFVDGAGISDTAGPLADTTAPITFDESFGEGELRGNVSSDSPEKATVVVTETSRTNGVTILNVEAEARKSDIKVNDVTLNLTATGTSNTAANVFHRARLYAGNTLLSTKAVTSGAVVFNKVDYKISEDDIADFRVEVDFNQGNQMGTTTAAGFTVVSLVFSYEDEDFATDTETVTVNEAHTIVQDGLVAKIKGTPAVTQNNNVTTVTFKMDVTAYGEDFWISATTSTALQNGFVMPNASTTLGFAPEITVSGVTKNVSNNFRIVKGQTRELTATYTFTNGNTAGTAPVFVTGQLNTLTYGPAAGTATGRTFNLGAPDFQLPTNTQVSSLQP